MVTFSLSLPLTPLVLWLSQIKNKERGGREGTEIQAEVTAEKGHADCITLPVVQEEAMYL